METTLRSSSSRHAGSALSSWWVYLLSGILLIVLGIVAFQHPVGAYLGLSVWFAAIIFMNGAAGMYFAYRHRHDLPGWGWLLALGAGELVLGFYLLSIPVAAAGTLAFFIGFWLLFRSMSIISAAFAARRLGAGIVGGLFALMVLANPGLGALGASVWLALGLLALGLAACVLAFRLRSIGQMRVA